MKHTKQLTFAAALAALYAVLTILQNTLLPGSASANIQFRASEALCVLALFTPAAIPGLTVGCLLANLFYVATLPFDCIFGTLASLLAAGSMYLLRNVRPFGIPLPALLMPALFNGLIVGAELLMVYDLPFWLNVLYVAVGEAAVLLVLGLPLFYALRKFSPLGR